jgi:hypothetical protein
MTADDLSTNNMIRADESDATASRCGAGVRARTAAEADQT